MTKQGYRCAGCGMRVDPGMDNGILVQDAESCIGCYSDFFSLL